MAAMRTTTLQERLAGASVDYDTAFQAAEAALRAGEEAIKSTTNPPYIYHRINDQAPDAATLARGTAGWDTIDADKVGTYDMYGAENPMNPRFIIEYQRDMGVNGRNRKSLRSGAPPSAGDNAGRVYKVIALGRGVQTNGSIPVSDVVLQSTVVR